MAFGALFINDHNRVQIDDTTSVLSLVDSGSAIATLSDYGTSTTRWHTLTVTGRTAPVLAIGVDQPSTGQKGFQIVRSERSGTTWTFTIFIWHSHSFDFNFRWYVFDTPDGSAATGWGMILRNASSQIVFNSNLPPARSVSAMTSGRTYAAVHAGPLGYQENFDWDSETMQSVIIWSLYCSPFATYPGAGTMEGFVAGGVDFQSPNIPWLTSPNIALSAPILLDVTGYPVGGGGLPPGYDWLVHPTNGEQLTVPGSGEPLIWAA